MGITSLIGWLFGADTTAPPDAMKLDGTTEATLARSMSALPTGRAGMDHVCRDWHLVLDRGRPIRVRRNGPGRQKKHRVLPRTVVMVGRPDRSIANLSSNASRNASLFSSSSSV